FEVLDNHGGELAVEQLLASVVFGGGPFLIGGEQAIGREALHGKGTGDANALVFFVRLVEKQFGFGVTGDGSVDSLATHAPLDFRIVGDAFERNVWNALMDEAFLDGVV